jgi:hypothetical protein
MKSRKNNVVPTLGILRQVQAIFSMFCTQATPDFLSARCSGTAGFYETLTL